MFTKFRKYIKYLFNILLIKLTLEEFENLLKHASWSILGSVLSRVMMLAASIVLARVLTQNDYGALGIIKSTVNMFVVFSGFGIGSTTSRYISLYKKKNIVEARRIFDVSFLFIFIIAIIVSMGVFIFSKQISIWSFNDVSLYKELRISSFLLFFATINGSYTGSLAGFQDFKSIAKNTFFSSFIQAVLTIFGGIYYGVSGALIAYGIGYSILFVLHKKSLANNFGKIKRQLLFRDIFTTDKDFIWSFGIPAALSGFLVTPVFWWTKSYLIRKSTFEEMALFDVSDQWRMILLFIPSALIPIVLPALTDNIKNYNKTLNFNIRINFFLMITFLIPLIFFSKNILSLYGDEYGNTRLFVFLISSALFSSFSSVVGSAIASLGIMWTGFVFNLLWAIYMILFSILFINQGMGAMGLAYAVFLSYLIHGISQFIFLKVINKNN